MSASAFKIKNYFNQDFLSLGIISILVTILIIIQNSFFSIFYPIGFCLGIGLFVLILKYPKAGLYLLIFNLPLNLYVPLFGFGGDRFSVSVNEILMALLLISLLAKKLFTGKISFPKSHLNRPILLLIAVNSLSLFLAIFDLSSADYMKCWLYFLLWAEYFLIYFLILDLIKTEKEIQTIFALLIIAGIISVLSAIYQQFVGSELHAIGAITEAGKTYYRLATPFGFYSNHFGAYLLIILSLLLQLYFASTKGRRFGYLLLILPTLYALFYTFSRGSFLGLIALVSVLLILNKEQRKKIVFFSIIFTILSLIIFSPVFLRWSKKANIRKSGRLVIEYNIRERLSQWEASWDQFSKHPIIGEGFETYRYRAINYQSNFGFVKYIDHPDNAYAKMLIESGILGLLFFGMFVFQVFSFGQKLLKQEIPDQLKLIIYITLTSLPCFLVTSLTDSMFTVGRVLGPIVVLVGIMFARARIESIKI